MKELILLIISAAIVNNVVLSQFLGLCPFLGVSKKVETAGGMGAAVIFVITIASLVTSLIYKFILAPLDLTYLQTIVFILVIAALVQFVEMFLKKSMPALYESLGVYLPLITTNCAVLGVALNSVQYAYCTEFKATPSTAQFVVISGRYTPNDSYKAGIDFFKNISTNCTSAAITRMNTIVCK